MKNKQVLDAQRVRHVPASFGWVDHRLVRHGHIQRCRAEAWALYLFLVTVADAEGLSYYSDRKAAALLNLEPAVFSQARSQLQQEGLIAWDGTLYQVLDLETPPRRPAEAEGRRTGAQEARSFGEILGQWMAREGGSPCR